MALIVQKFGGSSVADREGLYRAARLTADVCRTGDKVVAVVSAQGDTTDELTAKAQEIALHPAVRELDVLLSVGEQISIALLCMALTELGVRAVSLTGRQAGIITDSRHTAARILRLEPERIRRELQHCQAVVVAGFQGADAQDDVTTLGRGGSDTSAVALACALGAQRCCIYTDVDGVYTADPRRVPHARPLRELPFEQMMELAGFGAGVLHPRSVELASRYGMPLQVLSSLRPGEGTWVKERCLMEKMQISSVTGVPSATLLRLRTDRDGALEQALQTVRLQHLPVLQTVYSGTECQFWLAGELPAALQQSEDPSGPSEKQTETQTACLSLVGSGLDGGCGAVPLLLQTLRAADIVPSALTAGPLRISVLLPASRLSTALQAVHAAFLENIVQ